MTFIRWLIVLAVAFLCGLPAAEAQLPLLSNVYLRASGVSVGYTTNENPGTIRWNPSITNLQIYNGAVWTNVSLGPGGSGSSTTIITYATFPLTEDVSATSTSGTPHSITGGATFAAVTGRFDTLLARLATISSNLLVVGHTYLFGDLDVGGATTVDGLQSDGNVVINGDLTVNGTEYLNTVINLSTTVVMGVTTQYVTETVYSTQVVYQTTVVYTNVITTNTITTYVNVGGTWDASNALWVATPHIYDPATNDGPLRAIGNWDFSAANVTGLPASVSVETDPSFTNWLATNTLSSLVETDPVFTNWLATNSIFSGSGGVWTNNQDGGGWLLSNVLMAASAVITPNNIYSTNIFPLGFVHIGGQNNRWVPGIITTSTVAGAFFAGGDSNVYAYTTARGAVFVGGRSNFVNAGTQNGIVLVGGENNTVNGSSTYGAMVGGKRNVLNSGTHSLIAGGEDVYVGSSHSLASGRGTTNTGSAYSFDFGYYSSSISAPLSFAGGDRSSARALEAVALGSLAYALHRGSFIFACPAGAAASSGTPFGTSGTNTITFARAVGIYAGKTSNDLWTVVLRKVVTNVHVQAYTPYCEGSELLIKGTNERIATAFGTTTNDWRFGPTLTP
ncbi:MAG: hypothetical protein E6R03_16195 [Hyphomicrobiaceae bacterium]|nr:MAG: hypothetical protein E6R03_16195 [Hyphomicrobiaceae bacterium]